MLLMFQFICYNWHYAISCILLLIELCTVTFCLEPIMHDDPSKLRGRCILLIFYLVVLVPLFLFLEWCMAYHFNELVRCVRKSEDYHTLLNKTGNPLFILHRIAGRTNHIALSNQ